MGISLGLHVPDGLETLPFHRAPNLDFSVVSGGSDKEPPELVARILTQMVVAEQKSTNRSSSMRDKIMETPAQGHKDNRDG